MVKRLTTARFILLAGDFLLLAASLWLALFMRFREVPPPDRLSVHLMPFALVSLIWLLVFYMFDLYGAQRSAFRRRLSDTLVRAHISAALVAALIFYFLQFYLRITPRIVLFLFTLISFILILSWRIFLADFLIRRKPIRTAFLSRRAEFAELHEELRVNRKYGLELIDVPDLARLSSLKPGVVVIDLESPDFEKHSGLFYDLALEGVQFVDPRILYEQIFDRVALSFLHDGWFLQNISAGRKIVYDLAKRAMDIAIALPLFLLSLVIYPFVILAIKLEDGGPIFVAQERVGENGRPFRIHKFRSMTGNDSGNYAGGATTLRVTRVGKFLRTSRIDELPQLISVLRGTQSLVGPRPELPALAEVYRSEIPYYDVRHIIKPGMSGWAQIYHENHPHHGTATEQTREKLSYDLYYVKHRSFMLDLKIAIKTLKTLVSFAGR